MWTKLNRSILEEFYSRITKLDEKFSSLEKIQGLSTKLLISKENYLTTLLEKLVSDVSLLKLLIQDLK